MLLVPIPWAGRVWALPFLTALAPSERYARERGRRHKRLTDWGRQLCVIRNLPTGPAGTVGRSQKTTPASPLPVPEPMTTLAAVAARTQRIRLASAAESASTPAPNFHPPRLLGNTGEEGEFILPLNIPAPPGSKEATQKFDDFTYSAASWTLTAHEARPGHELQFSSMLEHGLSQSREVYAFNSTNVEGWGLYAEAICEPYMPPDGQLISLQLRLARAARAFLDPELQAGKVTPEQAKRVLMQDVGLSDAMSNSEVERYMFWAPGQATTYFYGYTRLMELRRDTEKLMGKRFNQQAFHDFILAQGLLPPPLHSAGQAAPAGSRRFAQIGFPPFAQSRHDTGDAG